jgi:hypothetical protein
MADGISTTQDVVRLLSRQRINLSNEKQAQQEIETVLTGAAITFSREHRLDNSDIPDFFLSAWGLAIEVKLKGANKMDVFKQLRRYAKHDDVKAVLLVTGQAMGLPPEIEGKPCYYVSLGRGWL